MWYPWRHRTLIERILKLEGVMKTLLAVVMLASLVALSSARAQGKPDFSGSWKMDPSRSESAAQAQPIGPVTLVITQASNELKIETTRTPGGSIVTYKLDGSKVAIPDGTATAHWDGMALVTEAVLEVQGQTVSTKETRTLSADGNEMFVDRTLVVQHGYPNDIKGTQNYVAGKDVFVRSR
jgi:hypothetical protein